MRQVVLSLSVLLALAALTGCSSAPKAKSANEVITAMNNELAHTVEPSDRYGDTFAAMDTELSHAVGTTMLTNATVIAELKSPPMLNEMPLPDDRMSLGESAIQTWGGDNEPPSAVAEQPKEPTPATAQPVMLNLSEIPDTRD